MPFRGRCLALGLCRFAAESIPCSLGHSNRPCNAIAHITGFWLNPSVPPRQATARHQHIGHAHLKHDDAIHHRMPPSARQAGRWRAAYKVFLISSISGKKAKHAARAGGSASTFDTVAGVAGGSLEPFRGRASRWRREHVCADELGVAAFGALGAEPVTGARGSYPPPPTRVKNASTPIKHTYQEPQT